MTFAGFELIGRIGRGGMGVVDRARASDGTEVALKRLTLHGSAADMARAHQRIAREAEVLTRLDHPNIVGLLDVVDDGGEVVLVMPYLSGGTLGDRVREHGPAPADEVEHLAGALLGALAAAHRAGVVHRDIKPANVLFDGTGEPHLADFGVASTRDGTVGLTLTGTVVGTPGFMSPEQARGEVADKASDVFSLGATLLHAATGSGPYGAGDPALLMTRAAAGKVERVPRTLPLRLRRMLEHMLEPRAERRPTAASLAGGVAGTVAMPAVVARRRLRWALVAGAVAVTILAVALSTRDDDGAAEPVNEQSTATTAPCNALPYRPCGQPAAPFTDGTVCIDDHDDYDDDAGNGCEAAPDAVDGTMLEDRLEATIVPRTDADSYTVEVGDGAQLLCDGRVRFTLTAPAGMSLRLDLLRGEETLATLTSADGTPQTVTIDEPSCLFDDATTLTARVSPIGSDRSGAPYVLERSGSF